MLRGVGEPQRRANGAVVGRSVGIVEDTHETVLSAAVSESGDSWKDESTHSRVSSVHKG